MRDAVNTYAEIAGLLTGNLHTSSVLESISQAAMDLTGARNSMITIVDYYSGTMRVGAGTGAGWDSGKRSTKIEVGDDAGQGITAYVAATGESYMSGHVASDKHYKAMFPETQSELAIPISDHHGRLRGVLNVESDRADAFTGDHMASLKPLAAFCDVALQLQLERRRQEALIRIGTVLAGVPDEETILHEVMQVTAEVLAFEACSIFIWSDSEQGYVLRATRGALEELVGAVVYKENEGLTGWVAANGESVRLRSPSGDSRWSGRYLEFPSEEISAFLAIPIPGREKPLGVLRLIRRKLANPYIDAGFTEKDELVMTGIAALVGAGFDGARSLGRLVRTERMAAWGEMSARASHMIGNRVFALKGDLNELQYLVGRPATEQGGLAEIVDSAIKNVNRLEEILADYRDFVMATQLRLQPTNINELIRTTLDETFPKRTEIKLELALSDDVPETLCDADKLRRMTAEMVENSLHFQERGVFRVTTGIATAADWPRRRRPRGGREYIRIAFEDQGPGVPEEKKAGIFTPFQTSRVRGMGLGLSIAKGIIDAHDGMIFEDGTPGKGARFVILLPVRPVQERKQSEDV